MPAAQTGHPARWPVFHEIVAFSGYGTISSALGSHGAVPPAERYAPPPLDLETHEDHAPLPRRAPLVRQPGLHRQGGGGHVSDSLEEHRQRLPMDRTASSSSARTERRAQSPADSRRGRRAKYALPAGVPSRICRSARVAAEQFSTPSSRISPGPRASRPRPRRRASTRCWLLSRDMATSRRGTRTLPR